MAEILISGQTYNERQFNLMCGGSLKEMQCSGRNSVMWPYVPYTIGQTTREETRIIDTLNCGNTQNMYKLSSTVGQDNVVGVSSAMVMLHDTAAAVAGSTTAVHAARSNGFVVAVQRYQDALLAYRDVARPQGASGSAQTTAGQAIHAAFENMQKRFQHELRITALSQNTQSLKGTPLTNRTRAKNIALSSRSIEKLQLVSTVQASAVGQFSKYGKALGNGLVLVDVGSRITNVHNSYKADGDWERELFIESNSFALSAIMGLATVKTGVAFLVLATPAGWIGLIVVAATASLGMNYLVKEESGGLYDYIMEKVNFW